MLGLLEAFNIGAHEKLNMYSNNYFERALEEIPIKNTTHIH